MYLYENKDNALDVYELKANNNDLINYRIEQMKKISEEQRVMYAETRVCPYGETPLLESYANNLDNDKMLLSEFADNENSKDNDSYNRYHVLRSDLRNPKNNEILLGYYNCGCLTDKNVVQIEYLDKIRYYLLKKKTYDYLGKYDGGKNFRMDEIIQLPESLYLLQLLEQEKFTSLVGKNISEQLSLYNFGKINEISTSELHKMDSYGLTDDIYSKTMLKAKNNTYILKLLKK